MLPWLSRAFCYGLGVSVLLCGSAEASLLVYEPFDYAFSGAPDSNGDGKTDLGGQTPGSRSIRLPASGWNDGGLGYYYIQQGPFQNVSLTAALPGEGQRLRSILSYDDNGMPRNVQSTSALLNFTPDLTAAEHPVLWFSFLVSTVAIGTSDPALFPDRFFFKLESADRASGVAIGHAGDIGPNWLVAGLPESGVADPTVAEMDLPVTAGELLFFVGKLTFATGGLGTRIDLWANPSAGENPPISDPYTVHVPGLMELGSVWMDVGGQPGQITEMDEIRIGTEWRDVAAPEPGTAATLCASAGLLGLRRLRRA